MPQDPKAKQQESATKIVLIVLFLGGLGVLAWVVEKGASGLKLTELSLLDIILTGFATFRLGRMISYDRIMDPIRAPFTRVVDDNSGEGKTIAPKGKGVRQALGQLIACPTCIGTWVAAFLVLMLLIAPQGTRIFLYATGAVALAEILNSLTETLCWAGRSGRTASGLSIQQRLNLKEQAEQTIAHRQIADNSETDLVQGSEE
ncbi:MAG: DUF1360 domain-containing protein [Bellilinea sp.]